MAHPNTLVASDDDRPEPEPTNPGQCLNPGAEPVLVGPAAMFLRGLVEWDPSADAATLRTAAAAFQHGQRWALATDPERIAANVATGLEFAAGVEAGMRLANGGEVGVRDQMTVGVLRWFLEGMAEKASAAAGSGGFDVAA